MKKRERRRPTARRGLSTAVSLLFIIFSLTIVSTIAYSYALNRMSNRKARAQINVYNDATPAMAGNITIQYFNLVSWEDASLRPDFFLTNYGNGTYLYAFTITQSGSDVDIRIQVYDLKGVYVEAEETFYEA